MAENDTVASPAAETVAPALGSDAAATTGVAAQPTAQELQAQLDAANKKANQAEMRARQLENDKQESDRKALEAEGNWEALAKQSTTALAEIQAQKELDNLLADQPEAVRSTYKKIMAAGDAESQLAALKEVIKDPAVSVVAEKPQPSVEALNPNLGTAGESILTQEMTLAQQADALEKALKGKGL